MGRIFIARPEQYSADELAWILKHEDAHNQSRHWLDLLLVQVLAIVFWFHPLVWRFRYLLQMQHEFEADKIAAGDQPYEYGHFLLQQTLLKGTPVLAHSFHFSPIKNRITMLTQTKQTSYWKYLAVVPVLMCCTVLMAKTNADNSRVRTGNKTTYKENNFYWSEEKMDTLLFQGTDGRVDTIVRPEKRPVILRMNQETVYAVPIDAPEEDQIARFQNSKETPDEYLKRKFTEKVKPVPAGLIDLHMANVVISKEGRMVYFEMQYVYKDADGKMNGMPETQEKQYTAVLEDILENAPLWQPKLVNGKPVNTFFHVLGGIRFKELSFHATPAIRIK